MQFDIKIISEHIRIQRLSRQNLIYKQKIEVIRHGTLTIADLNKKCILCFTFIIIACLKYILPCISIELRALQGVSGQRTKF